MALIGNHPGYGGCQVESISADKQLTINDSGKIFMVTHSSAVLCNLPKMSTKIAGWSAKFVTKTSGGAFSLVTWGNPVGGGTGDSGVTNDGDTMVIKEMATTDAGAATGTSKDGVTLAAAATAGDSLDVFTDGSNWYVTATVADAAHSAAIDS